MDPTSKKLQQKVFWWICVLLYVLCDITKVYQNLTLGKGQIHIKSKMADIRYEMLE